jgi:phosphoribosylformylglycinamidine synthase
LKYAGLSPTEIWISEAQERMVLAVDPANIDRLRAICDLREVEMCELGHFGIESGDLVLRYHGTEVGRLSMAFLHEGLPRTTRVATWDVGGRDSGADAGAASLSLPPIEEALLKLLAHPNIASKRWIIRQYDHEVQGGSVITPLVGPDGEGPSDAAVILPVPGSTRGLAVANGLATGLRDDPQVMTLAAIDECVRNLVCVGADPARIALLDNFCWPSCDSSGQVGALVRAAEACYEAALAYRTPFISGKDSLNNQFTTADGTTIEIPPTLLISGLGVVRDVSRCVTMDAKTAGNVLVVVGKSDGRLDGSHFEMLFGAADHGLPAVDLEAGPAIAAAVHAAIAGGLVRSAHACSDGGLLVAAAEMAIAGDLGLELKSIEPARCFSEEPSRYLLEIDPSRLEALCNRFSGLPLAVIGTFNDSGRVTMDGDGLDVAIGDLKTAWLSTLDW